MSVTRPKKTLSGTEKSQAAGHSAAANPLDTSTFDVSAVGWSNLEQKFNELRSLMSAPTSGLNANQARLQQKKNVSVAITQLLDRAQQECRRLLIDGNAKAAVEGGLKTLKLKEEYYGHGSLQLVPVYFHLARTNQYMDKFKAAEEFLSLAQWTILRNKDVDVSIKAELHQTFGLLYASDSKLDAALKQLTCATYYLCVMNGPEHILTSFGYFDLGNVFAAKSNMENAMAFYDKVKDIWYAHLTLVLRQALEPDPSKRVPTAFDTPSAFGLENLQDAVKMLRGIVGLQTERYGKVHPSTSRAEFVLGMFMLWNGDAVSAVSSLLKALEISKRVFGDRHPNTSEIRSLLLNYGLQIPEDASHILDDPDTLPSAPVVLAAVAVVPKPPAPPAAAAEAAADCQQEPSPGEEPPEEPLVPVAPEEAAGEAAAEGVVAEEPAVEGEQKPSDGEAPAEEPVVPDAPEEAAAESEPQPADEAAPAEESQGEPQPAEEAQNESAQEEQSPATGEGAEPAAGEEAPAESANEPAPETAPEEASA